MMRLKLEIDYGKFFSAITACQGDVYFDTIDNDYLYVGGRLPTFTGLPGVKQTNVIERQITIILQHNPVLP